VIDISHHQEVTDWDVMAAAVHGIIHKASEGGTWGPDDKFEGRRKGCAESELLWGAYHFANGTDVDQQVENFLRCATPKPTDLVCLDWEDNPGGTMMSAAQAREWIEKVEKRLGRPGEVVIYGGNTLKEQLHGSDEFFGSRRLWLCQYGSNPTVPESWDETGWWLWQYSDGASGPSPRDCPGVSHPCDTNSYAGTPDELRAEWASGKAQPAPEPDAQLVIITIKIHGVSADNVQVEMEEVK